MKTIVIKADSDSTLKLFYDLARKLGLKSQVLSDKRKEDIALIRAIDEGLKSETLPISSSYKILDKLIAGNERKRN